MNEQPMMQPLDDESLRSISELAELQVEREKEVADLELKLELANEALAKVRDFLLPDAMMSVGMESFKLKDGTAILISKFYSASIPKDRTTTAFAWLRNNGFSELIKREIKTKFGKGQDDIANKMLQLLKENFPNWQWEDKEAVHPQTLKAFVREQIEAGKPIPMEDLGVFIGNRAKVTPSTNK